MTYRETIAVISDEVSQDIGDLVRFFRSNQLRRLELRSLAGHSFRELTSADLKELKHAAKGEGWEIVGCASPVFKCALDDASAVKLHIEEFQRAAHSARELGCDLVRVFSFLRQPEDDQGLRLMAVFEQLARLAEIARQMDVRIGLENEHSCAVATADELLYACTQLPSPIYSLWDPCNSLYLRPQEDPLGTNPEAVIARACHVHVKDAYIDQSSSGTTKVLSAPLGLGFIDWPRILKLLQARHYSGLLSLETHWRQRELSSDQLHQPAGYRFSAGGEEATLVCLRNLEFMMSHSAKP